MKKNNNKASYKEFYVKQKNQGLEDSYWATTCITIKGNKSKCHFANV